MTRNRHRFVDTALNAVKSLSRLPDGKIVAKGDFTFVRNGSRVLVLWRPFGRFQGIRKELDELLLSLRSSTISAIRLGWLASLPCWKSMMPTWK